MIEFQGKVIPETIEELMQPQQTALIVIDMLNDWCTPNGVLQSLGGDLSLYEPAIGSIAKLLAVAREVGVLVVHAQTAVLPEYKSESPAHSRFIWHLMKTKYGRVSDQLALAGGWGQDFVEPLRPADGEIVIQKHRSSAFAGTSLDGVLRSNGRDRLVVTGCATEGCVDCTAKEAEGRDYFVVIAREAVATDVRELHDAALKVMSIRFPLATTTEIIDAWHRHFSGRHADRLSEVGTP